MNILITGASGFIGTQLVNALKEKHQLTILSRSVEAAEKRLGASHQYLASIDKLTHLNDFDSVINLAGEPIAGKRWSEQQKQAICQSRWDLTSKLSSLIEQSDTPPHTFISASAIGYYGDQKLQPIDESFEVSQQTQAEFTHQVCRRWEDEALKAQSEQTRVCIVRIGLVLGRHGGALAKMLPAFKLGLGGPIGNGQQGMSWIHQADLIALISHLTHHADCEGVYNGTAPNPVSNKTFTQALGKAVNRPACIPAPTFALKLALGEMSSLLIEGQYVTPRRALAAGFVYQYPELAPALAEILGD
ncbi:TIGR01777 family oxidoreductase [Shewanella marinintestina]|uniref:TIGR01777 family oxidoreductase n=1 Tax=Shewanella marinintestina TaxID=190305 RepID=UPI0020103ADB|nr:TIGR01777 family oxidoreductase [Shewanella marinintestina]MCL1147655.1 TIGR01777 family oxidoreductase [Shewanella marinintestina]